MDIFAKIDIAQHFIVQKISTWTVIFAKGQKYTKKEIKIKQSMLILTK